MADQKFRSQQRDPGSSQASSGAKGRFPSRGEDPLAELARLIGEDDPFADFRDDPRAAPRPSGNSYARNGHGRDRHAQDDYDDRGAYARAPARQRRHVDDDPRQADANVAHRNGRSGAYAYGGARAPTQEHDHDRHLPQQPAARRAPHRQAQYEESEAAEYENPRYARGARGGNGYDPNAAYEQGPYDPQDDAAGGYEPEYEGDQYAAEYDEQAYVEPAPARRWLYIGGAVVLALLILGGAGVYGYRTLFGKHAGGTPPTIHPADVPNKVAPQAAQTGEGGQKLIYDRLDGPKQGERIVSREEQPAGVAPNTGA